jgi:hypothetical protein
MLSRYKRSFTRYLQPGMHGMLQFAFKLTTGSTQAHSVIYHCSIRLLTSPYYCRCSILRHFGDNKECINQLHDRRKTLYYVNFRQYATSTHCCLTNCLPVAFKDTNLKVQKDMPFFYSAEDSERDLVHDTVQSGR